MRFEIGHIRRWLSITRWPWITLAAGVLFALSPFGNSLIHSAFYSGEQLARSLSQFLLTMIGLLWGGLVLLEWLVRVYMVRRRAKRMGALPTQAE